MLAAAGTASDQIDTVFAAVTFGVAAPLILENLAKQLPFSTPSQEIDPSASTVFPTPSPPKHLTQKKTPRKSAAKRPGLAAHIAEGAPVATVTSSPNGFAKRVTTGSSTRKELSPAISMDKHRHDDQYPLPRGEKEAAIDPDLRAAEAKERVGEADA